MMNTSKILTVSYGTFSCTLEGFDDSFDTMKAIAEYFRDLASDDRYFGAEPPVPDTAMLARIAEREISRHVEAHEDQGTIVLRAQSEEAQPADVTPNDVPTQTIPATSVAQVAPVAVAVAVADAAPIESPAPVVVQNDILPASFYEAPPNTPAQAPSVIAVKETNPPIEPSDQQIEDAFEDFTHAPAPDVNPDSVAAKLKRIRAVVSHAAPQEADQGYNEDEHAVDFLGDAVADIDEALALDDATEGTADSAPADVVLDAVLADEIEIETTISAVNDDSEKDEIAPASRTEDAVAADGDADTDDNQISQFLERMNTRSEIHREDRSKGRNEQDIAPESPAVPSVAVQEPEDASEEISVDLSAIADEIHPPLDAPVQEQSAEQAEDTATQPARPPVRARVLKVKRSDFEAAISRGEFEEDAPEEQAVISAPEVDSLSSLSFEQEAELLSELAEVEAEHIVPPHQEADLSVQEEKPAAQPEDILDRIATQVENTGDINKNNEQDLSRILAETNTHLDEPEGKTRRNAIAHLRAAVAATNAEKAAGNDTTIKPDTSGAYRDDLASVVRPRRPVANDAHRLRRPTGPGAAPLKLVAEQRVDADTQTDRKPVRPRRISLAELAAQSEATIAESPANAPQDAEIGSFGDFAETMGATKLPDLLEAAAAYLSFVEGCEKFSRPQLMTKVRQVEQEEFSREDGLRSFGQLLRQGKIQKLKGGRFTVSERINYKPDERHVG